MPNLHNRLKKMEVISMRRRRANDDAVFRVAGLTRGESLRRILSYGLDVLDRVQELNDIPADVRTKFFDSIARVLPRIESPDLAERCRAAIARSYGEGTEP